MSNKTSCLYELFFLLCYSTTLPGDLNIKPRLCRRLYADLFKIFSPNQDFARRASEINNALGLFGAYISDFFLNSTIGFSSIVFPVIMFVWGVAVFKNQYYRISIYISNFLVSVALIVATLFGVLRSEFQVEGSRFRVPELPNDSGEWRQASCVPCSGLWSRSTDN